jgi:hypothetical protein
MLTTSRAAAMVLTVGLLFAAGCGGHTFTYPQPPPPGPPVGKALMPDLSPAPPLNVRMGTHGGRWYLEFDSSMVNVGKGSFMLRATRTGNTWAVTQYIPYSTRGARPVPLVAQLVWGGDGHNHWHIARIASTKLVRLDANSHPDPNGGRVDQKVGFCFYDLTRWTKNARQQPFYSRFRCGHHGDKVISMGLSPGWEDTYPWTLPGQSIDVTGLHDGMYRLVAQVDPRGWFKEANRSNDVTWVDIKLFTRGKYRFAQVMRQGPTPATEKANS